MKKWIFCFLTGLILSINAKAQIIDDGFVTQHLSVDLAQRKITDFIDGFKSGASKYKNGDFSSSDAVVSYYGINILTAPSVSEMYTKSMSENYNGEFSSVFLGKLNSAFSKVDVEYFTVEQLRNDFISIAKSGSLSQKEMEAIALIDLTLQISINAFVNEPTDVGLLYSNADETALDKGLKKIVSSNDINEVNFGRLPRWFKCGLGTIGSAVLGGLTGAGTGFTIGGLFGAVVGGIVGVVSGTVVGVASFCD